MGKEKTKKIYQVKREHGITLIALVILIIVLLILTGIAIIVITGENGIINKTSFAEEENNKQSIRERLNLQLTNILTTQIINKEEMSKVHSLDRFEELNYDVFKDEATADVKCYIIEGGYVYEIIEKDDNSQEIVYFGDNKNIKLHVHTPNIENPTCQLAKICTECGVELSPKLPHTPGPEATCTQAQICTVCGEELSPKLPHTPGPEATCTQAQICTVCGEEINEILGHSYKYYDSSEIEIGAEHPIIAGIFTYKCSNNCGIGTSTHTVLENQLNNDSTHYTYICSCGNCQSTQEHSLSKTKTSSVCRACSVCGYQDTSHNYGGYTITTEATCKATGSKYRTCKDCGYKQTTSIPKASHSYGGKMSSSCKKCGTKTTCCTWCSRCYVCGRTPYY